MSDIDKKVIAGLLYAMYGEDACDTGPITDEDIVALDEHLSTHCSLCGAYIGKNNMCSSCYAYMACADGVPSNSPNPERVMEGIRLALADSRMSKS